MCNPDGLPNAPQNCPPNGPQRYSGGPQTVLPRALDGPPIGPPTASGVLTSISYAGDRVRYRVPVLRLVPWSSIPLVFLLVFPVPCSSLVPALFLGFPTGLCMGFLVFLPPVFPLVPPLFPLLFPCSSGSLRVVPGIPSGSISRASLRLL